MGPIHKCSMGSSIKESGMNSRGKRVQHITHLKAPDYLFFITGLTITTITMLMRLKIKVTFTVIHSSI